MRRATPLRLFLVFAILLLAALVYSRIVREVAVPAEIAYIPTECSLIVATGDVTDLWGGIGRHFGSVIKAGQGSIAQAFKSLHKNFPFDNLKELYSTGIDLQRGILLGFQDFNKRGSEEGMIAVVPVRDFQSFNKYLTQSFGSNPEPRNIATSGKNREVTTLAFSSGVFVAFPSQDVAVISQSLYLMQRSLLKARSNLEHARDDDELYNAVRHLARRRLLSGSLFFVQGDQLTSSVRLASVVLRFDSDDIKLSSDIELANRGITVVENILAPPPARANWDRLLPSETICSLAIDDRRFLEYLRFYGRFADSAKWMRDFFGGIIWQLRTLRHLDRAVLAVTSYSDGLPDFLLGLWGDPKEIQDFFDAERVTFRQERDQMLLGKALDAYRTDHPNEQRANATSPEALLRLGYLHDDSGSSFQSYKSADTKFVLSNEINFADVSYQRNYRGYKIRFLSPPITADDIRYRPEFKGLNQKTLEEDRYRLVYLKAGGACWLATNIRDFRGLLDKLENAQSPESLAANHTYRAAQAAWKGSEKLQFYLNLDRAIAVGLLSPESGVEDWVKKNLYDLRNHPAVSLGITTNKRTAHIELILRQRQGI